MSVLTGLTHGHMGVTWSNPLKAPFHWNYGIIDLLFNYIKKQNQVDGQYYKIKYSQTSCN